MPEGGRGETSCFARSALASCAQRAGLALNLLRVDFARGVRSSPQATAIDSGRIGLQVLQPKRLQHLLQLDKAPLCSTAEHIRQDSPTQRTNRRPQPARVGFALPKAPHLIYFYGPHSAHFDQKRSWTTPLHYAWVYLREAGGFF